MSSPKTVMMTSHCYGPLFVATRRWRNFIVTGKVCVDSYRSLGRAVHVGEADGGHRAGGCQPKTPVVRGSTSLNDNDVLKLVTGRYGFWRHIESRKGLSQHG